MWYCAGACVKGRQAELSVPLVLRTDRLSYCVVGSGNFPELPLQVRAVCPVCYWWLLQLQWNSWNLASQDYRDCGRLEEQNHSRRHGSLPANLCQWLESHLPD